MSFDETDGGERGDTLDAWCVAVGPWRPRPLSVPDAPMPPRRRLAIVLAIALGHALALWALVLDSRIVPDDAAAELTTLVFIAPEPLPVVPRPEPALPDVPPEPAVAAPAPTPTPRARRPLPDEVPVAPSTPVEVPASPTPSDALVAVEPSPRDDAPLSLYDSDGTLALPEDVVARIGDVESPTREFDFQLPGLMESGRFMQRQPVMAYESTRFDEYWIPEKGALTRILEKAVKATTGTVEIPIPGTRGGKLVCSVSILALGGGCGVRNNSNGFVVRADDPATLSPEEDAQCKAWWEQIVAADDQDGWRHTRDLYDFSCRKPLAVDDAPPE